MTLQATDIVLSIFLFIIAGIAEIGGGYLIWKGIRDKWHPSLSIPLGCFALIIYGFIPTFQPMDNFGRLFAIYGGFFIVLSYCWAMLFENMVVDKGDIIGASIAMLGVCICWFWPR